MTALNPQNSTLDISYGIYTIERLPKGSRRTPKWDLHSIAQDRETAEIQAKTLSAQPYFDHIEIQEFRIDRETKKRIVNKIKSYSRHSSLYFMMKAAFVSAVIILVAAMIL